MNIIKIFLLSIIILIFYLYNKNIIEGIDILDSPERVRINSYIGAGLYNIETRTILNVINRNLRSKNLTSKKILININESKLSFLTDTQNLNLKDKKVIATILYDEDLINDDFTENNFCMGTFPIDPNLDVYLNRLMNMYIYNSINSGLDDFIFLCKYNIQNIENININLEIFPRIQEFLTNQNSFIPSKTFNKNQQLFSLFNDNNYYYHRTKNLNILNIINENNLEDYIQLEILDYLDTETNEKIKITKEKIKKYIYSQFLQ